MFGTGKTRLVQSLTGQVDVAGGYVVSRKFDAVSKKRPLLEVVSAFNDLCLRIKEKLAPGDLAATAAALSNVFGAEISILVRLLPNLRFLLPWLKEPETCVRGDGGQTNSESMSFILQRFVRVVSSTSHPVLLFLDDLQVKKHVCLVVLFSVPKFSILSVLTSSGAIPP